MSQDLQDRDRFVAKTGTGSLSWRFMQCELIKGVTEEDAKTMNLSPCLGVVMRFLQYLHLQVRLFHFLKAIASRNELQQQQRLRQMQKQQ